MSGFLGRLIDLGIKKEKNFLKIYFHFNNIICKLCNKKVEPQVINL